MLYTFVSWTHLEYIFHRAAAAYVGIENLSHHCNYAENAVKHLVTDVHYYACTLRRVKHI